MSERLARLFHEAYERLAPEFGYETREETRDFDPKSPNGQLMIAVCGEVEAALEAENTRLREENARLAIEAATADQDWKKALEKITLLEDELYWLRHVAPDLNKQSDFTLDDAERLKSLLGVSVLSCDDDIREARRLARKLVERWYPQLDENNQNKKENNE